LGEVVPRGEEAQEPQVPHVLRDREQTGGDRLKVSLQAVHDPDLLLHELAAPAAQPLQLLVLRGDLAHFLQHVLGQGKVVLQVEQLQDLPGIKGIRLRWPREHLAEAGQLEVVHVVQPPAVSADLLVKGAGVAARPLHRHRHRELQFLFPAGDPLKEDPEPFPSVGDVELLEERAVWSGNPYPVSPTAHVDADPNAGFHRGPSCLVKVIQEVSSTWQSDTP